MLRSLPSRRVESLATFVQRSIPLLISIPFIHFTAHGQSEKLGSLWQTDSGGSESKLNSPKSWDAFRLPPPPMSPSWSCRDVSLQVIAATGVTYDDNIGQDSTAPMKDARWEVCPQFRSRWEPSSWSTGNYMEANYSPQSLVYFDHDRFNTINHKGGISLSWSQGKTTVDFKHDAALTSEPSLTQSVRDRQSQQVTILSIVREVGSRSRINTRLNSNLNQVEGGGRNWEIGAVSTLEYLLRDRVAVGGGYGFSYVDSSSLLAAMIHEPQVSLKWIVADHTRIGLAAGLEIVNPVGAVSAGSSTGFMVDASAQHNITEKTSVILGLSRRQRPSYYVAGQLDELTHATVGISYSCSERISLGTTGLYGHNSQTAFSSTSTSAGSYSFWQAGLAIRYIVSLRIDLALAYSHAWRDSNLATPAFDRNTIGLKVSYRL